ncbi:hypothetical protein QTI33_08835 [Variovorax sp. J22P271]|uniref:hypothetical protein n=1 Tax=Variovorax davisae TaxID=3053515 RepID=UPI0025781F36|nr:hypothetical protein [Variovorax sp. J22P271]MDM0032235.1 hypothetical protein [Variovorax sp. J22P271]
MAIDLLREIASSPLPKSFRSPDEIDQIRLLRAAGLVIAFVPARTGPDSLAGPEHTAQVLAVTDKGRQELESSRYPDEERGSSQSNGNWAQRLRSAADRVRQALQ